MGYLIVFAGAGFGGALRHGVNLASERLFGAGLPYGTLIVNVVGSLLMGLLAGYFIARMGIPQHVRLFLTTGVLGGFTTFSAFSLEIVNLAERGALGLAAVYAGVSVVVGIAGLFAGLVIMRVVG